VTTCSWVGDKQLLPIVREGRSGNSLSLGRWIPIVWEVIRDTTLKWEVTRGGIFSWGGDKQ
jgi:hypothetical protein